VWYFRTNLVLVNELLIPSSVVGPHNPQTLVDFLALFFTRMKCYLNVEMLPPWLLSAPTKSKITKRICGGDQKSNGETNSPLSRN
jgi:hypothetical protein